MLARLYRLLLHAYPRGFRARFGDELTAAFLEGLGRARAIGPWRASTFLSTRLADAVLSGLAERWSQRPFPSTKGRHMMLSHLAVDLRAALRLMRRQPGFTLVVVLTLAIGIGANTAVFSLIDGMLLRPLPYRDPGQLGFLWTKLEWIGVPRAWMSGGHVFILQNQTTLVEDFVALQVGETQLTGTGQPEQVRRAFTTANVFEVLGVSPQIGRSFQAGEDRAGAANVVVLSHALWQQAFGADAGVLGRRVMLGGVSHEVVGVMPAAFRFMSPSSLGMPVTPDVWIPGTWDFASLPTSPFNLAVMVRLKPGVTLAQARAELDTIGSRLDREQYGSRGFGWHLAGVVDDLTAQVRPALWVLAGAAALVLLIACANVASLFLVRGVGRERELALRAAIGASRGRLAAQLLVEALTLTGIGAAIALVFAVVAVNALKVSVPAPIPRLDQVAVDWRVLAGTIGVTVAIAVVFALLPMVPLGRPALAGALKEGGRSVGAARTQRLRSAFVVGEVAMALMLVFGAVLLIRTFAAIRGADPGFQADGVLTARVSLPPAKYPQAQGAPEFIARIVDRVSVLPDVVASGAANAPPLSQRASQINARPTSPADAPRLLVDLVAATPGYLRAAGLTLIRGRDFDLSDRPGGPQVCIVDQEFARTAWPNDDALGKTLRVEFVETDVTVVGLVRQAHLYHVHRDDRAQIYRPHLQSPTLGATIVARANGDPAALGPAIRRIVAELDPAQPVAEIRTLGRVVEDRLFERRLSTNLLAMFAGVAVLLAAVGLNGLMAYAVSQRTAEIGVRIALGAELGHIERLVLGRAVWLTATGLAIGAVGAYAASGWLRAQLYGVSPTDAVTFAAVAIGLLVVALASSAVPARRAARVDPVRALRSE
jgi:predicted permease